MNQTTETRKLERAITTLATTITEIVRERIQFIEEESERRLAELPDRAADPILTKQKLAKKLRVGERTITDWMRRRKLPLHEARIRGEIQMARGRAGTSKAGDSRTFMIKGNRRISATLKNRMGTGHLPWQSAAFVPRLFFDCKFPRLSSAVKIGGHSFGNVEAAADVHRLQYSLIPPSQTSRGRNSHVAQPFVQAQQARAIRIGLHRQKHSRITAGTHALAAEFLTRDLVSS